VAEWIFAAGVALALAVGLGFLRRRNNLQTTYARLGYEKHPTDVHGNYIPARMGRLFLVSDSDIAWYRVGDIIKDWRGNQRQITHVNCGGCYYCVAAEKGTVEPITFEEALRINGYPASFNG
jgi:hypothetical protein